jgi:cytidylate kinase
MQPHFPVHRVTEGLAQAQAQWRQRRSEAHKQTTPPTIAIAREAGCPGSSVAQEVGRRLSWPVYDKELLEHISQESGIRLSLLESVDEQPQGWLRQGMQALFGVPTISEQGYVYRLAEALLSLSKIGRCIFVGRGAPHILPDETTLRVRLIAPRDFRVAAYAQRFNVSPEEAARKVDATDHDRTAFVKHHFRHDPTDPLKYDLVLNMARWSVGDCADLIVDAVHHLLTHSGK